MSYLSEIANLLELNESDLTEEMLLEGLESWGSISVIGFIAMADEVYGVSVMPSQLREAKTIGDLIKILNNMATTGAMIKESKESNESVV